MDRLLTALDEDSIFTFILYHFGQGEAIGTAVPKLNQFRLQYADELVLHYATDYEYPGHLVGWKRKYFKNPDLEYYPGLLTAIGNFYMQKPQSIDMEILIRGCRKQKTLIVEEEKFYSFIGRSAHRVGKSGILNKAWISCEMIRYALDYSVSLCSD